MNLKCINYDLDVLMKNLTMFFALTMLLTIIPAASYSAKNLSEEELGEISAQNGATFVIENFDFYAYSPGMTYLDSLNGDSDSTRGSVSFQGLEIHDGISGPAVMSAKVDWDIYSQTIGDRDFNFAKFSIYNTQLEMDVDSRNVVLSPYKVGDKVYPFDIGGVHIHGVTINNLVNYMGAVSDNTGFASEIGLNLAIKNMTIDIMKPRLGAVETPIQLNNIMVAGHFTGSEPEYDRSVSIPNAAVPGLWSEAKAESYSNGDPVLKAQLLAANRWVPDPDSWEAHGLFKIGDVMNGNPMRMDMVVDNNYYIPFPYDIISGESTKDNRVEWFEAESGELFDSDRGWRDGKDNYITDGTRYKPIRNPRYGKAYLSSDAQLSGSLRLGSAGGDILVVDGINLQIHAEIPGYGYGNTPNSIPRPYPDPNLPAPRYDTDNKVNNLNYNDFWK